MEKLGVTDFFSVKNIGSQLEINKKLLGGYKLTIFYRNLCSMTTPVQIINALLVYDNTAVPKRCHTIFDYQILGHNILPRYLWKFMNT